MKALIFDTETSGLIDNHSMPLDRQPEVIEFAGMLVDLESGATLQDLELLIRPERPVSAEVTGITRITNEMLAGAPAFRAVAPQIELLLSEAQLAIAHNASYDQEILNLEFERLGRDLAWPRVVCTVEATVHLKGFRLSLTGLHELLFNEPVTEAHRAKNDTVALARCAVELWRRGEL